MTHKRPRPLYGCVAACAVLLANAITLASTTAPATSITVVGRFEGAEPKLLRATTGRVIALPTLAGVRVAVQGEDGWTSSLAHGAGDTDLAQLADGRIALVENLDADGVARLQVSLSEDGGRSFTVVGVLSGEETSRLDRPWVTPLSGGGLAVTATDLGLGIRHWTLRGDFSVKSKSLIEAPSHSVGKPLVHDGLVLIPQGSTVYASADGASWRRSSVPHLDEPSDIAMPMGGGGPFPVITPAGTGLALTIVSGAIVAGEDPRVLLSTSADSAATWTPFVPVSPATLGVGLHWSAGLTDGTVAIAHVSTPSTHGVGAIGTPTTSWGLTLTLARPGGGLDHIVVDEDIHRGGICTVGARCAGQSPATNIWLPQDRRLLDFIDLSTAPGGVEVVYGATTHEDVPVGASVEIRLAEVPVGVQP
jgi:hypothetical protein